MYLEQEKPFRHQIKENSNSEKKTDIDMTVEAESKYSILIFSVFPKRATTSR